MTDRNPKVRIRMYRQGLGDCFLLTFFKNDKMQEDFHMLIDCGSLGAPATGVTLDEVIDDISDTTTRTTAKGEKKKKLDLLVITHEHWDHVSGFDGAKTKKWSEMEIANVWVGWTENQDDPLARQISQYKNDLFDAVQLAVQIQSNNDSPHGLEKRALQESARATRKVLTFVTGNKDADWNNQKKEGLKKDLNKAMRFASERAGWPPKFLSPGTIHTLKELPGWRFFVMGPPPSWDALSKEGEEGDNLYLAFQPMAVALAANARYFAANESLDRYRQNLSAEERQKFDASTPFDARFRVGKRKRETYKRLRKAYEREAWRCIDYDWLGSTEDFALQMDSSTNNTSVVLAIECMEDGRVLLFPGDAQLGNWESWQTLSFRNEGEKADLYPAGKSIELLNNTVFYKVGHHASHNATMKIQGLEQMGPPNGKKDFVAMISVDSQAASKKGTEGKHWNMPALNLYKTLLQKTEGRVLRSDRGWPDVQDNQKPPLWGTAAWSEVTTQIQALIDAQTKKGTINSATSPGKDKDGNDVTYSFKIYSGPTYEIIQPLGYQIKNEKDGKETFCEEKKYIDYVMY